MPIKDFSDMKEKKDRLISLLDRLSKVYEYIESLGFHAEKSETVALIEKLKIDSFRVLVIGEFKTGKSTFIDSMLGQEILPAYSTPCTAVINEVKYDENKHAVLYFKNPLPENWNQDINAEMLTHIKSNENAPQGIPPVPIAVDDLADYVTIPEDDDAEGEKNAKESIKETPFDKVELYYPLKICKNGIEIIDSPGLNEAGARTKVTDGYLDKVDAVVFVLSCTQLLGQTERDYIVNNIRARGYKEIFFVCNRINQVRDKERERIKNHGNKKLSELTDLGEKAIFYVNALGALEKREKAGVDEYLNVDISETGMDLFERELSEYLRNQKGRIKLLQILNNSTVIIERIANDDIQAYIGALGKSLEKLNNDLEAVQPEYERARNRKENIKIKIDNHIEKIKIEIREMLIRQYDQMADWIPFCIESMELENSIGFFDRDEDTKKVTREIVGNLENIMENEMGAWASETMTPYIETSVNTITKDIVKDVEDFYKHLDKYKERITGSKENQLSGIERADAFIENTMLSEVASSFKGEIGGGVVSALVGSATFTGVGLLLGLFAGPFAILGAAGYAIGSLIFDDSTDQLKKQLSEHFVKQIKENKMTYVSECTNKLAENVRRSVYVYPNVLEKEMEKIQKDISQIKNEISKNKKETDEMKHKLLLCKAGLDKLLRDAEALRTEIE